MKPESGTEAIGAQRALYLRWRPQSFAEVVGQEAVTRTLKNAVVRGTVAHGYLLCGPRGTGKTSIARILFKAVNCQRPTDGEPCKSCESCQSADAGRAMDLIEIDAASNRGIDDIRTLRERVRFAPAEAKWKVYIVDEAHQLTPPAWDAFLKTLEEPPPHTVFVLATTAVHKVPATIISRCQRFDLRRIPQGQIAERLARIAQVEGMDIESGVADRVARLARGSLRDALGMLDQIAAFAGTPVTLEAARRVLGLVRGDAIRSVIDALARRDSRRALQVIEDVAQEGADLRQFLGEVLLELRAALLLRAGAEEAVDLGVEERAWLQSVAQQWAPGEIVAILRSYGQIDTAGADEHQLLIRLELATVSAAGLRSTLPEPRTMGGTHRVESPGLPPPVDDSRMEPAGADVGEAPPGRPPSLAVLQARWPSILDRFQGSLFAKVLLDRMTPVALDGGTATLEGRIDPVELQRLEASCRPTLESLLVEEFEVALALRFIAAQTAPELSGPASAEDLAEYASALFGGQLIAENVDITQGERNFQEVP